MIADCFSLLSISVELLAVVVDVVVVVVVAVLIVLIALAVAVAILLDDTILLSFELDDEIDEDVEEVVLLEGIEVVVGACLDPSFRFSSECYRKWQGK